MVTEPTQLTASATASPILCHGELTTVNIAASGGTAPYTGNGPHTVAAGPYTFTVTDANGCTTIVSGTITEPALFTATKTEGTIPCHGGTTTVTIVGNGGTAPYTGDGVKTVSSGPYSFTVTDANGCTTIVSGTISQPALFTATKTEGTILCNGGTTTLTIVGNGGTAPYTGDGVKTVSAGPYTFTVTDANGCTTIVSGTISQPAVLMNTAIPATVACNANTTSVTVTAAGGTPPYSGVGIFTNQTAGMKTYFVTDANGCISSAAINIVIPAQMNVTTTNVNPACGFSNGTITANASGGIAPYTYLWTGGQTNQTRTGVSNGTYTVTVMDSRGCTRTASSTINVGTNNPPMPGNINGLVSICKNQTNVIYSIAPVAGATSYNWLVPGGASIIAGQGTTQITVNFTNFVNNGDVSVRASNICGASPYKIKSIYAMVKSPVINGLNYACKNQKGLVYSVTPIPGATSYTWTVVPGSTIVSGLNTNSITVNWGSINGTISVKVNSACGSSTPGNLSVAFTCKVGNDNQTNSNLIPYPVPTDRFASIDLTSEENGQDTEIAIYNLLGERLIFEAITLHEGENKVTIDCSTLDNGTYIMKVHNKEINKQGRILIER
jgi:hypothetical protein